MDLFLVLPVPDEAVNNYGYKKRVELRATFSSRGPEKTHKYQQWIRQYHTHIQVWNRFAIFVFVLKFLRFLDDTMSKALLFNMSRQANLPPKQACMEASPLQRYEKEQTAQKN